MAARAAGHAPVGSTDWILKEFGEISTLCENELEDFTFSARNEAEWLNEHMADIFSSKNLNLAEIMKTPGKLRGKTPRTVRQRSPLKEARKPLGEIAAIDKRFNSPVPQSPFRSPVKLAAVEATSLYMAPDDPSKADHNVKDSGYHGDSDSQDNERELPPTQDLEATEDLQLQSTEAGQRNATITALRREDERSTENSFHSAKENQTLKDLSADVVMKDADSIARDAEAERASEQLRRESAEQAHSIAPNTLSTTIMGTQANNGEADEDMADASSENTTPAKTIVRKSSLTFATLPAREPLATKKSMGNRTSGNNAGLSRASYFGRITGGKSLGAALHSDGEDNDEEDHENPRPAMIRDESDGTGTMIRLHSKSSTQRLHDRISALSKTQVARPTKSIPATVNEQTDYPVLPEAPAEDDSGNDIEPAKRVDTQAMAEEGSWMPEAMARNPFAAPERPKTATEEFTANKDNERPLPFQIHQDDVEFEARTSTTPVNSPPKHVLQQHGPLNASKSKLQSIMQSARGLFSSSAASSAQAKLEAGSVLSPKKEKSQLKYPTLPKAAPATLTVPEPEQRRTRSSTEKEENRKREEQERCESDDEIFQGSAPASAAQKAPPIPRKSPRRANADDDVDELAENGPERPSSAMGPPTRPRTMLQKPGTNRRQPTRPAAEQPTQQKVSIKIGSMAVRRPLTAATLSSASKGPEDQLQQRPGTAGKKESTASHSTTASSAPSFKSSTVSTASKPKALLAAERKKEADEKVAQRKLEQKREIERRKAAQQEETQRREQERQAAARQKERERQVEEERKRQEQRQAVEKKRAEQMAKREQLQRDIEQQKAMKSSAYRNDAGSARPPSRQATMAEFPRPPSAQPQNKGPKRVWNPDQEDEAPKTTRPQPAQNYQPTQDGKRRKTDDDETFDQVPKRPTMAPPVRISNIAKSGLKSSIFGNNYPRAPPPASHHHSGSTQTGSAQTLHHQQPYGTQGPPPPRPATAMDMARFQNGAIPFAGVSNAHAPTTTGPSAAFKTPHQPSKFGQPQTQQAPQPKSSPFINGEYLHLDEIPTDSEDEDSEDERDRKANMPDWVLTPNLQQTLADQEAQNPDAVFGPIAPLNMEEMFKDRKGQARFRSRTSSANWFGADRLTEEEKARDLEAREKIRKEGGWSFGL